MQTLRSLIVLGAAFAATPAFAFPPSGNAVTSPLLLSGNGNEASVIFAFEDAGDDSNLNLVLPPFGLVLNNSTTAPGTVFNVGAITGQVRFSLENLSTGQTYFNDTADSAGAYHFFATTNYADFGVGAINPDVQAAIDGLPTGTSFIFVGAEDRDEVTTGTDYDYNDIIYVFTQLDVVPAPATVALFGLGLVGLAGLRRRA